MIECDDFYIDAVTAKNIFKNKKLYIFGTGLNADCVKDELSETAEILAFVDNYRFGKDNFLYGKRIISLQQCVTERKQEYPIIIATYRYAMEISKQLVDCGLVLGKDFYIWDDVYLFRKNADIDNYITFLKEIWESEKIEQSESIIMVPFANKHLLEMQVKTAYCSNYFAKKYNAKIYGFFRWGVDISNAAPNIIDIYKAFNVDTIIEESLNEAQEKEVNRLCDHIWESLDTWEKWNKIEIYNIHFGATIIRDYLRTNIPTFNLRDEKLYLFLKKCIKTIVYWYQYLNEHDVKVIFFEDGVGWDGYIRDIAISKGIPAYEIGTQMNRLTLNWAYKSTVYPHFKELWKQLTEEEQEYGLKWSERQLQKRLKGGTEEVWSSHRNMYTFAEPIRKNRILEDNDKLKVIIFPHIFEEDCMGCGEQIFDNNYFAWLCHLGELSEKTPQFDWYIKMHPNAQRRDFIIMDMILEKYPKIKRIQAKVSPVQLKEEGARFALTIHGTIGHEFPLIGIQVINAGNNPHVAYDFTWNPKTKDEYDELILNLESVEQKLDVEELYQFYSLYYLFYDWKYVPYIELFFKNPLLSIDSTEMKTEGKKLSTWLYREYMNEWTKEKHYDTINQLEGIFIKLDTWRPDILYKNQINMNKEEL